MVIDYSKWDQLKYSSSSSSEEEDEGEKEAEITLENLSISSSSSSSSSPIWTGLVLHHKDVFVSHVILKLNTTDRFFFSEVNRESRGVLEYAGVNVSKLCWNVHECSSISTLEWGWNDMNWGEKDDDGNVMDQAWFCEGVAGTNKFELLKWAREVKHCEWDEETILQAAFKGNLEMLKYCFSNGCPYNEKEACKQAAIDGPLLSTLTSFWRSVRFLTEIKRPPPPPFPPLPPPLWRDDDARSSRRDAPSFVVIFFFPKRATPFAASPKGNEEEEKEVYQDEDDEGVSPGASQWRRRNRPGGFEILFRRRHRMFCEPLLIGAFGRH